MRIILQENVEKLGTRGEVVDVSEGYARNYLLPRKLAIPATEGNTKRLAQIRASLAKKEASEKGLAEVLASQIAAATVTLTRKSGESDQLFGSVTSADIAEALAALGYNVDKRKIQLDEPIKLLGEYSVPVKLHHEVSATVKVVVNREE
jgi:large subunit ribosomal protein L9